MIVTQDTAPAKIAGITATPLLRLQRARELHEIHNAVCRARRQQLACSTCGDLAERVKRLEASRVG